MEINRHLSSGMFSMFGKSRRWTKTIRKSVPEHQAFVSYGVRVGANDAAGLQEGADIVGVARVAIGHPDWPLGLENVEYNPKRPPFEEEHLANVNLSPVFIAPMKR